MQCEYCRTDTGDSCKTVQKCSPATDGDFTDANESVPLVRPDCSGVVLSTHVYSDLGRLYHLLQDRCVVEVIVTWPQGWVSGQQAECDVTT